MKRIACALLVVATVGSLLVGSERHASSDVGAMTGLEIYRHMRTGSYRKVPGSMCSYRENTKLATYYIDHLETIKRETTEEWNQKIKELATSHNWKKERLPWVAPPCKPNEEKYTYVTSFDESEAEHKDEHQTPIEKIVHQRKESRNGTAVHQFEQAVQRGELPLVDIVSSLWPDKRWSSIEAKIHNGDGVPPEQVAQQLKALREQVKRAHTERITKKQQRLKREHQKEMTHLTNELEHSQEQLEGQLKTMQTKHDTWKTNTRAQIISMDPNAFGPVDRIVKSIWG